MRVKLNYSGGLRGWEVNYSQLKELEGPLGTGFGAYSFYEQLSSFPLGPLILCLCREGKVVSVYDAGDIPGESRSACTISFPTSSPGLRASILFLSEELSF